MPCSSVGIEIWVLVIFSAVSLYLFTFGARPFQRWLRSRRPRSLGLRMVPAFLMSESSLWALRGLAVIPAMMLLVAILGVICFLRGPG
jgi:hypothetical protein